MPTIHPFLRALALSAAFLGCALTCVDLTQAGDMREMRRSGSHWVVTTPGGHLISNTEKLVDAYGTCLRRPFKPGSRAKDVVLISHLEWWAFVEGHVIGLSSRGHFIFDESSQSIEGFESEPALQEAVEQKLGVADFKKITPADTWQRVWMPQFMTHCRRLEQNAGAFKKLKPEEREAVMKEICEAIERGEQ